MVIASGSFGPDGLLALPEPIDVVTSEHARPVLQAADDELAVLRLELSSVDAELDAARAAARVSGADPAVLAAAQARLDQLVDTVVSEAQLEAAAVTAHAARAAAAVVQRAEAHAHLLRTGQPLVAEATAVVPPIPFGVAGPPTVPAGRVMVPHSSISSPELEAQDVPPSPTEHYAKTLGTLQVVTWSVLVAAVLIVLLAWFA